MDTGRSPDAGLRGEAGDESWSAGRRSALHDPELQDAPLEPVGAASDRDVADLPLGPASNGAGAGAQADDGGLVMTGAPIAPGRDTQRVLAAICPYLLSEDGSWRAARPMREHRCTAVRPPAVLPLNKQRRLCLLEAHRSCPAFLAAQERRTAELAAVGISERGLAARQSRPLARTVPVALDRPSAVPGSAALLASYRRLAQIGLAGLMLLAATVLILARFTGGAPAGAGASATPTLAAVVSPTPSAEATPSPEPTARPTRTPRATPADTPRPRRTYTVRRGDTLTSIADRFNTTVERLQQLNGIDDPSQIQPGQVLRIR
jgi:LysM domain